MLFSSANSFMLKLGINRWVHRRRKLTHFVITVAVCNNTIAFCNRHPYAFCNRLFSHFAIIYVVFCNNMYHVITKVSRTMLVLFPMFTLTEQRH